MTDKDYLISSNEISSRSSSTWNFSMQLAITWDLMFKFTGFWREDMLVPKFVDLWCSDMGIFWSWAKRFANDSFRKLIISLIDFSAKLGFKGSSEIELDESSWLNKSQSSMFSKLRSWMMNFVVLLSFSIVTFFSLYLRSFNLATSSILIFISPLLCASIWAFSSKFYLLEMLSIICWLAMSFSIPCSIM